MRPVRAITHVKYFILCNLTKSAGDSELAKYARRQRLSSLEKGQDTDGEQRKGGE